MGGDVVSELPKGLEQEQQLIAKVYERWHIATEKFDYFVTGGTGALCAFIAQTAQFGRLGVNPSSLELVALLTLIGSVVAGFMVIERMNDGTFYNHLQLFHESRARYLRFELDMNPAQNHFPDGVTGKPLSRRELEQAAKVNAANAQKLREAEGPAWAEIMRWQEWRNRLLAAGFFVLVAARVWAPYVSG